MSKTVKLEYPVEVGGVVTKSLSMRRPKVRDDKDARRGVKDPADQEVRLFANLCEVAPDVIEELDLADYQRLQDAFRDFFTKDEDPA